MQFPTRKYGPPNKPLIHDGLTDMHELIRAVRRERDAFPEAGFSPDQDVAMQVRHIQLDAPGNAFAPAEHGRANLDNQNFPRWNDDGVKESPRLKLQPVGKNPVFL